MKASIPAEIQQIAQSVQFNDCAHCIHINLMEKLALAGYGTMREVEAYYQGVKGIKRGRIDIMAFRDGFKIGIEVDNCTPRPRSIKKLLGMTLDYRFVVLRRRIKNLAQVPGIDGIFYIEPPRGFGGAVIEPLRKTG